MTSSGASLYILRFFVFEPLLSFAVRQLPSKPSSSLIALRCRRRRRLTNGQWTDHYQQHHRTIFTQINAVVSYIGMQQ